MQSPAPDFVITRTLRAPRALVFQLWTDPAHLLHWWGPAGMKIAISKLDLRAGGIFHYSMQLPDNADGKGATWWGRFRYEEVAPPGRLVFINSFSDEQGGITRAPFEEQWPLEMRNVLTLTEENGITTMTLRGNAHHATAEEQATYLRGHASMNQGFGSTFAALEAYLATL